MGVLKANRGISEMEFYHTAVKLRKDMTVKLLRDFGIKRKKEKGPIVPEETANQVMKEHPEMIRFFRQYNKLLEETRIHDAFNDYPEWLVFQFRDNIMEYLRQLVGNITAANTIYPVDDEELKIRRDFQTMSIVNCEQIIQELQYAMAVLPVDVNKLIPYVDTLGEEIKYLKGWRKANNKIKKRLAGRKNVPAENNEPGSSDGSRNESNEGTES